MEVLIWDDWNKEHIKKHNVTVKEVEETYRTKLIKLESYAGRKMLLGATKNGRLLSIIVSFAKQKQPYVVSARDMSKKERIIYDQKKNKINKNV